jgi:hypothetical protein
MLPLSLVQGNMPNTVNTPETSLCTTITATTCTIPINPAIKPYMSLYQSCRLRESELRALEVYYAAPRVAARGAYQVQSISVREPNAS